MSTLLGLDTDNSRVGEFVEVTPTDLLERKVVGDNNKYRCQQLPTYPDAWSCHLLAPDVSIGDSVTGWIFVEDDRDKEVVVTTDDYGRADLHSLRGRYQVAANHIAGLAGGPIPDSNELDLDALSEAKGMASRCLRRDQPDWYTVFHLLGKPPHRKLRQSQQALADLRTAAKDGDEQGVRRYVSQLRDQKIAVRYALFVRRLNLDKEFEAISDRWLIQKLHQLSPAEFEEFVASCWEQRGFDTTVVGDPDDIGIDIEARKDKYVPYMETIQVKRWDPDGRSISLEEAQRYRGATDDYKGSYAGYLVTTGSFTGNAEKWAADVDSYVLIDGQELAKVIRDEELYHVVSEYVDLS